MYDAAVARKVSSKVLNSRAETELFLLNIEGRSFASAVIIAKYFLTKSFLYVQRHHRHVGLVVCLVRVLSRCACASVCL